MSAVRILVGDCLDRLRELDDRSVHCCVTSPPYWGLRDYQVDGQLGLEASPEEYVARMVDVFREVRRVLRDDGTCWLNIGDSYNSNPSWGRGATTMEGRPQSAIPSKPSGGWLSHAKTDTLKPKDLVGIPWRLAFSLQADGWWLRSEIIWSKPNPMPESVTDRPTTAHERVFLLAKSARYFYDADAVREPAEWARWGDQTNAKHEGSGSAAGWIGSKSKEDLQRRSTPTWDERKAAGATRGNVAFDGNVGAGTQRGVHGDGLSHDLGDPARGRNLRSVWTIPTEPYPEAHFATFPTALVEPCVKAGTSERGVCPDCGAPWERETEETAEYAAVKARQREKLGPDFHMKRAGLDAVKGTGTGGNPATLPPKNFTTGWRPTCDHDHEPVPATVLDPFGGAGTTGYVAQALGRDATLIELNPAYAELARKRMGTWNRRRAELAQLAIDGAA